MCEKSVAWGRHSLLILSDVGVFIFQCRGWTRSSGGAVVSVVFVSGGDHGFIDDVTGLSFYGATGVVPAKSSRLASVQE